MTERGVEYLNGRAKRQLDLLSVYMLGIAGVVCAPLTAAVYAAACIDNRSFVPFFRQMRYGRNGVSLEVVKLRTIPKSYDADELKLLGTYDPRSSVIGRVLRRSGLDEVPQLLSVLKGDMSFINPRPLPEAALNLYQDADPSLFGDWYATVSTVKPGLYSTSAGYRRGLSPDSMTSKLFRTSMLLDIADVEQASLRRDVGLLAGIPKSMRRREADAALSVSDVLNIVTQTVHDELDAERL